LNELFAGSPDSQAGIFGGLYIYIPYLSLPSGLVGAASDLLNLPPVCH
jgi:hypothetical protein